MRQIQNGNNKTSESKHDHKFFICTHKNHPFPSGYSERVGARPSATRLSILYCQCTVTPSSAPAAFRDTQEAEISALWCSLYNQLGHHPLSKALLQTYWLQFHFWK